MSQRKQWLIPFIVGLLTASLVPAISSAKRGEAIQPFPAVQKFSKAEKKQLNEQWAGKVHSFRAPGRDGVVKKQPNGRTFVAVVSPAEVGGRLEDATGRTIIQNAKGWWTYAKKGKGGLVATNLIVGRHSPKNIPQHVGRTQAIFIDPTSGKDLRTQLYEYFRSRSVAATQAAQIAAEVRNYKIPAILFQTDDEFSPGSDAATTEKFLSGFGTNPRGSVTEFYMEMSYGQMNAEVDVYGPYQSLLTQANPCHYGGITVAGNDLYASPVNQATGGMGLGVGGGGVAGMAVEAIPMADVDVDFSQYDNDDDGFVDLVFIIHSGPDMAITGDPCHTWSHAISLQPIVESVSPVPLGIPTNDGVFVANLNTVPELGVEDGMNIGVVSHEMSHNLGEPDFYDTSYKSEGTGGWDNMAEGSHFGDPPDSNPIHFNPMVKLAQAWIEPKVLTSTARNVRLRPWEVYKDLVMIPLRRGDDPATEEVETDHIIEAHIMHFSSRSAHGPRRWGSPADGPDQPAFFDKFLLNSGLMVWHMDRSVGNNNDSSRYRLDLEEFDYLDTTQELALGEGGGEPTDPYFDTATGLSGATRIGAPGSLPAPLTFSGTALPSGAVTESPPAYTFEFTVPNNPAIYTFTVTEVCASEGGDWDLYVDQLIDGRWVQVTSGATGACSESAGVSRPELGGQYRARINNFLAPDVAGGFEGKVSFGKGEVYFRPDTFDNEGKATGWSIGNVRPAADDIYLSAEVNAPTSMTFDAIRDTKADVSPGFLQSVTALLDGAAGTLNTEVFNNGPAAAQNVTATLSEGSTVIGTKNLGTLAGTTAKKVSFPWRPASVGVHALTLTVATSSTEASTANNKQVTELTVNVANAPSGILIVDDDDNYEMQQAYEAALTALGVPFAVTDRHPTLAELKRYEAVFWEAGRASQHGLLSSADLDALRAYLLGGGRAWFSGPWFAGSLAAQDDTTYGAIIPGNDPAFAAQFLGIGFKQRIARGGGLAAVLDKAFSSAEYFFKPYPGRPNSSVPKFVASPFGTAKQILGWKQESTDLGLSGTTVVGDAAHKRFRTVFTAFNLGNLVTPESQIDLVRSTLKALKVTAGGLAPHAPTIHHVPLQYALRGEAQVISVTLGGGEVAQGSLRYRRLGAAEFKTVSMKRRAPDVFEAVLPGSVWQPPGVEYALEIQTVNPQTLRAPRTGAAGYFVPVAAGPTTPELPYSLSRVLGARFTPSGTTGGTRPAPVGAPLPATGVGSGVAGLLPLAAALGAAVWLRRRPVV